MGAVLVRRSGGIWSPGRITEVLPEKVIVRLDDEGRMKDITIDKDMGGRIRSAPEKYSPGQAVHVLRGSGAWSRGTISEVILDKVKVKFDGGEKVIPIGDMHMQVKIVSGEASDFPKSLPDGVSFSVHKGFLRRGGDLLKASCTIEQAQFKALTIPGCKGFCFADTDDVTMNVWFKDHFVVTDQKLPDGIEGTCYKLEGLDKGGIALTETVQTSGPKKDADDWLRDELAAVESAGG